jgi:hypothetical protein
MEAQLQSKDTLCNLYINSKYITIVFDIFSVIVGGIIAGKNVQRKYFFMIMKAIQRQKRHFWLIPDWYFPELFMACLYIEFVICLMKIC